MNVETFHVGRFQEALASAKSDKMQRYVYTACGNTVGSTVLSRSQVNALAAHEALLNMALDSRSYSDDLFDRLEAVLESKSYATGQAKARVQELERGL